MPYSSRSEWNPTLKAIKPSLTNTQANLIAAWADRIAAKNPKGAWAIALSQWKKLYTVRSGKWIKRIIAKEGIMDILREASADDYLICPDKDDPKTWKLQVMKDGKPDHAMMNRAAKALFGADASYDGPGKAEAQKKLKAMFKSEDMEMMKESMMEPTYVPYGVSSFKDLDAAENAQESAQEVSKRTYQFQQIVNNIMGNNDGLNKVAAIETAASEFLSLIREALGSPTEEMPEEAAECAESESGIALSIIEDAVVVEADGVPSDLPKDNPLRAPVIVDFAMVKPGPGNPKDNHYYTREMLARDAKVFEGVPIYVTDHKDNERSERTKVGRVREIAGFTEAGAPIARTVIYDPDQAEKTRNRAQAGELATLECSILGTAVARQGKIDGQNYKIIESLTQGVALELVSKAGAGGHALNIAESEGGTVEPTVETPAVIETPVQEVQPAQPVLLAEADVKRLVEASTLPAASKERLATIQYESEVKLQEAVVAEIAYVKKLTGSGQPFAQGNTTPVVVSEADYQKQLDEIDRKYGIR